MYLNVPWKCEGTGQHGSLLWDRSWTCVSTSTALRVNGLQVSLTSCAALFAAQKIACIVCLYKLSQRRLDLPPRRGCGLVFGTSVVSPVPGLC